MTEEDNTEWYDDLTEHELAKVARSLKQARGHLESALEVLDGRGGRHRDGIADAFGNVCTEVTAFKGAKKLSDDLPDNPIIVKLEGREPRSAPDSHDGIETPEEAAMVSTSCDCCGKEGYVADTAFDAIEAGVKDGIVCEECGEQYE